MTTVLLDSHVIYWWSTDSERLSATAARAISGAEQLAVASITWFELAWLASNGRIKAPMPVGTWLEALSQQVLTVGTTPSIGDAAASLPDSFPGDPADRLIYATAIETGWKLVTKDERMRSLPHPGKLTVW